MDLGLLGKTQGMKDRKSFIMNGNKITVELFNYGGIGPGYGLTRGLTNLVWRNLDYIFQFCPIVGASVPDSANPSKRIHIISDALNDYPSPVGLREVDPTGTKLWQWQPLPGYADSTQANMASNPAPDKNGDGRPDSWPRQWYNPTLGKYVWPGYLSQDATSADLETFWAMDDRDNSEFPYYPFINDSTRRGIGLQVDGRAFQWSNPLAENCVFFVYTITNISDKDLDTLFFGIYGDPDLGGGCSSSCGENQDDNGSFIPPSDSTVSVYSRSMVYFWDPDFTGARGLPLGYVACKFLESPGNPNNGKDDDGDGMIDERQDDGIDNDHDWNPAVDDVGVDGIPNTNDPGESDGVPTAGVRLPDGSLDPLHPGEPNFELTDLDESDQIGLTSFNSWTWAQDGIANDESIWNRCVPGNFGQIQQSADIVFVFGSGYISLKKAETKRISMALLLGETKDDLLTTAKTVQKIYNQNYRFFKPPITPHMTAVPDDKKVTLYWDTKAELSVDPITGQDIEGYVIYRSTDPSFSDIQTITDGKGSQFLTEPLRDLRGVEAKWDVATRQDPYTDLNGNGIYDAGEPYVDANRDGMWSASYVDPWKGYHPVPYQDRGVQYFLGRNSGLVHSFTDTNNVLNGQTYYYAVVSYDHGDSVGIPPTECPKKVNVDPVTGNLTFDVNTAQVIPGPRSGGYVSPVPHTTDMQHVKGIGTGTVGYTVLNELALRDGNKYTIQIGDSVTSGAQRVKTKNFSVLDQMPVTETVALFDTNFSSLSHPSTSDDSFLGVTDAGTGMTYVRGTDYVMNLVRGTIRRTGNSGIPNNGNVKVTYRYFPVYESPELGGSDATPAFDGVRVSLVDKKSVSYDSSRSSWVQGKTNLPFTASIASVGTRKMAYPGDYEIRFSSHTIDTALTINNLNKYVRIPVTYSVTLVSEGVPQPIFTYLIQPKVTRDSMWQPGEEIGLFTPGSKGALSDTLTWGVIVSNPADSTVAPILPTDGDVLFIGTSRPFDNRDEYLLTTRSGRMDTEVAASGLDKVYVVPNPYVGYNVIEPNTRLSGQNRGERRIYFENLPPQCTIRIFTLNGDLVQTIQRDAGVTAGHEFWNLLNRDGFSVAYGVYFAHIDAPGIGEKIIKFAIIK
jgi:hypothetical protein